MGSCSQSPHFYTTLWDLAARVRIFIQFYGILLPESAFYTTSWDLAPRVRILYNFMGSCSQRPHFYTILWDLAPRVRIFIQFYGILLPEPAFLYNLRLENLHPEVVHCDQLILISTENKRSEQSSKLTKSNNFRELIFSC